MLLKVKKKYGKWKYPYNIIDLIFLSLLFSLKMHLKSDIVKYLY